MRIILKYIVTTIRERKTRSLVMCLSIVLSTVLLFVSLAMGQSYESAQRKMARGMAGEATISVSAVGNSFVEEGVLADSDLVEAKVGFLKKAALYQDNGYFESIDLISADLSELSKINKPILSDGGEIRNFSGNQVILPDRFTTKYGIKKGDTIQLAITGNSFDFEVAEIATYDSVFLRATRGATVLLPLETFREMLNEPTGFSEIMIKSKSGVAHEDLVKSLSSELPQDYTVSTVVDEVQVQASARQKSLPFLLISFFSLTMSIFIIYSSYQVITLERIPIVGTFRSIGATEKVMTKIMVIESFIYGLIGGGVGLVMGGFVLKLMLTGLGSSLAQGIEIPMVISPISLALPVVIAIAVTMISAYFPIHKVSKLPIKDIILGKSRVQAFSNKTIVGGGLVLLTLSILLPRIAPIQHLFLAGGFSLIGLLVAAILIMPLITSLVSKVLEPVYGLIFGNEGRLSARNLRGNKTVTQSITLLFISVSSIIAISAVGNFVTTYVGEVFQGAKIEGFVDGDLNQTFIDEVDKMAGIEETLPIYTLDNSLINQEKATTISRVEAIDNLAIYNSFFALKYADKEAEKESIKLFGKERIAILSDDYLQSLSPNLNDSLTLSNGQETAEYKIVGSFNSRATDVSVVIPAQFAEADFSLANYGFLAYTAKDPNAIMIQIRELLDDTPNWSRTVAEFNTDALNTVGAFLKPMTNMTYFILLLAIVGITNNLLINYIQNRRSLAMYKSVGLSNKQNIKMTLLEAVTTGAIGSLLGITISYLEITTIFIVAGPQISITPDLDSRIFIVNGLLGVAITLIGSIVPILKMKKMNLVEEIKFD